VRTGRRVASLVVVRRAHPELVQNTVDCDPTPVDGRPAATTMLIAAIGRRGRLCRQETQIRRTLRPCCLKPCDPAIGRA
jgi:hypothetical protein